MYIKVIVNPTAFRIQRDQQRIQHIVDLLKKYAHPVELITTQHDYSEEHAVLHNLETCNALVVIGGDGTLNRVVTYCIRNNASVPIALIPMGTANVFALERSISFDIHRATEAVIHGKPTFLDVGTVEDEKQMRYFLLMVGIGFDAHAVMNVHPRIKRITGKGAYILAGSQHLLHYTPRTMVLRTDGNHTYHAHAAIISNAMSYAGKYRIAPHASMHDGVLDMCLLYAENRLTMLRHILRIMYGSHIHARDVVYKTMHHAHITTESKQRIPFQFDGEHGGFLPITINILPQRIPFLQP